MCRIVFCSGVYGCYIEFGVVGSMCVQLAEKVYIAYTAQGTKYYFILHYERMNREEEEPTVALATEKSFRFFFPTDSDVFCFFWAQPLHCCYFSSFCLFIGSITLHFLSSHHCITSQKDRALDHLFAYLTISFSQCVRCDIVFRSLPISLVSLHYFVHSIVVCARGNERTVIKPMPIARCIHV